MAQTAEPRPLSGSLNSMKVENDKTEQSSAPGIQTQIEAIDNSIKAMIQQFKGAQKQITQILTQIQQLAALSGGESKALAHLIALAYQYRGIVKQRSTIQIFDAFEFDLSRMTKFDGFVTGEYKEIDDTLASFILQPKLCTMSTAKLLDDWEPMKLRWKLRDVDATYCRDEGLQVNAIFPESDRILAEAAGRRAARTKAMRAAGRALPVELVDDIAEIVFAMEWEERRKKVEKSVGRVGIDEVFGDEISEVDDEVEGDVENQDEDDDEYDYEDEDDDEDDFGEDYEGLGQLNSYHSSLSWM